MKNIYELTNQFMELQLLAEEGTFDEDVLKDTLEALEGEIEVKAENTGLVIKNLEVYAQGLKEESKRLLDRAKSIESNINSLKNNLAYSLQATGKTKFKTEHFNFSFRKSESVSITDQSLLPADYINVKTTETPNKTAIKKAIKSGKVIMGAALLESQNLQIK